SSTDEVIHHTQTHTHTNPHKVSSWCLFFSSRRRHTRFKCDWSSDVCSSDLIQYLKVHTHTHTDTHTHTHTYIHTHTHTHAHTHTHTSTHTTPHTPTHNA